MSEMPRIATTLSPPPHRRPPNRRPTDDEISEAELKYIRQQIIKKICGIDRKTDRGADNQDNITRSSRRSDTHTPSPADFCYFFVTSTPTLPCCLTGYGRKLRICTRRGVGVLGPRQAHYFELQVVTHDAACWSLLLPAAACCCLLLPAMEIMYK